MGILQGQGTINHQLIPQHTGHLNGLLHQPIAAVATADRCFVPLRQGIGDAAGQGARRSLANQAMVKHQQLRAARQGHITLKGSVR